MRPKHARSRTRRRVAQGRWTYEDLIRFPDRQLSRNRKLRKSMRELNDRGHPWMVLQHKYSPPRPLSEDYNPRTHSEMLHRRLANLKKIHTAYRSRS